MNYGYKSRSKSAASSYRRRSGGVGGYSKKFGAFKKAGRKPRYVKFATVGFSRNVERKYFDKTYQANSLEVLTGQTAGGQGGSGGVTYISNLWGNYSFGTVQPSASAISNDMLKGVATGTTARTRIGNKAKVEYVKGAFTFTAGIINAGSSNQSGESTVTAPTGAGPQYLRTTFRMVVVKDLQVNSTDTNVTWQQVFDTTGLQAGVHSELNVDNMGRFIVLSDEVFNVDADEPQKTIPFMIKGSSIGNVRYNGPSDTALTDKGVYVVWSAFVYGFTGTATTNDVSLASPVGHSRLCFRDD